jgi:hypothetical protein
MLRAKTYKFIIYVKLSTIGLLNATIIFILSR